MIADMKTIHTLFVMTSLIARFMRANMGPIWGRQDPGGPHVGPMNFAIWDWITQVFHGYKSRPH